MLEVIFFLLFNLHSASSQINNADVNRTTSEFILSRGYPCEIHTITTDDGYIITYHRIPHGKYNNTTNTKKPAVMLQHGILCSSRHWFLQPDDKILPFMLCEQGYDVWIGNYRGTSYSLGHVNLTSDQKEYWRFSWQEMALYDNAAAIDYILEKTGNEKLFYIGYSMGTTTFFTMCAQKPEYNDKIILMSAFAPIGYYGNTTSPFRVAGLLALTAIPTENGDLNTELGEGQQLPATLTNAIHDLAPTLCTIFFGCCSEILYTLLGYDRPQTNQTMVPVMFGTFPDYTSVRTIIHYGQEMNSRKFPLYDYGRSIITGEDWNKKFYPNDTTLPPNVNISRITAPIAFYSGCNDLLGTPDDIARMAAVMPNLVKYCAVGFRCWNHLDMITGIDAAELLYQPTIDLMNSYKTSPGQILPPVNITYPVFGCQTSHQSNNPTCSQQTWTQCFPVPIVPCLLNPTPLP